jgi:hypothetical protein
MMRSLDVLIAMVSHVTLKKDNQMTLMQGVRTFITDIKTRKKAYKLLALLVQNYELTEGISELAAINKEISPIVEAQATKQRLVLIRAYVEQIKKFANDSSKECKLEQVGEMLKQFIIELIGAMTNTNLKIRHLAQSLFTDINVLMRAKFNAVNQLFTIILVGMAGSKAST